MLAKQETKKELLQEQKIEKISICDLTRTNTSEIIQKLEYQIPVYLQGYTDLFTKYLHSFNTAFGVCRISEKQFFDKIGIDHTIMGEFAEYWNFVKNLVIIQIEWYGKFIEDYTEFRGSTLDSFNKSVNSALDYYTKAIKLVKIDTNTSSSL